MESLTRLLNQVVHNDESVAPSLGEALRLLDAAAADSSSDFDIHFRHYLQKRSYTKALDFLQNKGKEIDGEEA